MFEPAIYLNKAFEIIQACSITVETKGLDCIFFAFERVKSSRSRSKSKPNNLVSKVFRNGQNYVRKVF